MYLLMFAVGSVAMMIHFWNDRKSQNLSGIKSVLFALGVIIGGFFAGKLMHYLTNLDQLANGSISDGITIFGPILLNPLILLVMGRIVGITRQQAQDGWVPCVALFQGFSSVGCYFAGCCGGKVLSLFGHLIRWPAQAISSIFGFVIFALLMEYKKAGRHEGRLYPLYLIYYGTYRFLDEFLRKSEINTFGPNIWQWLSLVALLTGFVWIKWEKGKQNEKT